MRRAALALVVLVCGLLPWGALEAQTRSASRHDDGVYGRFGSDLALSIGVQAGAGLGDRGVAPDAVALALSAELRLRIFDSAGIVVAPEWRPDATSRVFLGVELRPVFLSRFLLGASTGDRYVDLFFDSLGVELGASLLAPAGRVGVGFGVGVGAEIPLYLADDDAWAFALRLGARWVGAGTNDVVGPRAGADDWLVSAGLLVRFGIRAGIASWEPERYSVR